MNVAPPVAFLVTLLVGSLLVGAAPQPPLDPLIPLQWHLDVIGAPEAWAAGHTGAGSLVAVLDSGADLAHADLLLNFWDEEPDHGTTVAQPYGIWEGQRIGPFATTQDFTGHGTQVAGVLAATPNNAAGVRGVADAAIMVVKIGDVGAPANIHALADGIRWAVDHGARVLSISQGALGDHVALREAVAYAEAQRVLIVAAAGNSGNSQTFYPAGYPTVVSVAALDADLNRASLSSFGKVDIAAPGIDIWTTALGNGYGAADGTSLAAPQVAGALAIAAALHPHATPADLREALYATARDLGPPGKDAATGHGLLDVAALADTAQAAA